MRASIFLAFCFFATVSNAQYGISGTYNLMQTPIQEDQAYWSTASVVDLYDRSYSIAFDYWWRPEKFRIELLPTLAFQKQSLDFILSDDGVNSISNSFATRDLSFLLNINIYPFDFLSDCDCPTFSKQDPIFKRGFYFQLSPGINSTFHEFQQVESAGLNNVQEKGTELNYRFAVGAGLDIGFSDLFTLSPFARYGLRIPAGDKTFEQPLDLIELENWRQWEFGIRFGLRFDE